MKQLPGPGDTKACPGCGSLSCICKGQPECVECGDEYTLDDREPAAHGMCWQCASNHITVLNREIEQYKLQIEDMKKIIGVPKGAFDRLRVEVDDQRRKVTQVSKLLEESNRLIHEFRWAANGLLAKLGTDEHPVEKAWEKEFLALELLVADETNKRVMPVPNCNHEYVKMPLRGPGSYCLNCKAPWLPV